MNYINETIAISKARQKFNGAVQSMASFTGEDIPYINDVCIARFVYNGFVAESGMNAGPNGEFALIQDPLPYTATWEQVAEAMEELCEICCGE